VSTLSLDLRYRAGPRTLHTELVTDAGRIAIVGRSGIGKTSLLRAVIGFAPDAIGSVRLRDARLEALPPEARGIGWVPQDGLLFPHLDVRRNLAFATEVDVDRVASLVGVAALLGRDVSKLSGGERQRVAVGRALVRRPNLLVLDEPLSALDREARTLVAHAIEEWRAVFDFVVLVASHDEMDVRALSDEVYVMDESGALTKRDSSAG
jgi:ABC-type sugar transport system ATPase subunit